MKTKLYILTILVSATTCYAATQSGVIFEVTGANKTSETYNNCSVYAYDGTSQNLTIKAYSKEQYYRYASGSTGNWWGDGSVTYSTSYWYLYQKNTKGSECTVTAKSVTYNGTAYSYLLTITLSSTQLSNTLSDNQICLKTDNSSGYYTPNIYIRKEPLSTYTLSFDANGGIIPIQGNMGTTPSGHTTSLSDDQTQGYVIVTSSLGYFRLMCADCPVREGYSFEGWFTDPIEGEQVYDEIGCSVTGNYWDTEGKWIGTSDTQLYAHWQENPHPELQQGALPGVFSISDTKKVLFSQGNLQYNASFATHKCADGTKQKGLWRFAKHQWDYVGDATNGTVYIDQVKCNNALISSSYTGWVDLFGWGTSGWSGGANVYQPYATGTTDANYGNSSNTLTGSYSNADWGIYNAIANGGDNAGLWHLLSANEWLYLIRSRTNAESLFGCGQVNGVNGLILLPDNWEQPEGMNFYPSIEKGLLWNNNHYDNSNRDNYEHNNYTLSQWLLMEQAGAVFLPSGGSRYGTEVKAVNEDGNYNTSSSTTSTSAIYMSVYSYGLYPGPGHGVKRSGGQSVRLVCDAPSQYTIIAKSDNDELGIVQGGGLYFVNTITTITAIPNECYAFTQWSDGNTDNPRSITVTGNASYTAEFTKINYTIRGQNASTTGGSVQVVNP